MTSGLCTTSLRFCPRPIPFTRFVITPRGYPLLKVGGLNLSKVTSRSGTAATAVPTVALGCFSGSQRCFFHKQCGSSHRFDSMNAQEIIAWTEAAAKSGEINRALWTAAAQRLSNVLESSGAPATCVIRCLRAFRSAGFVDLPLLKSAVNPCLRGLHRMKPTDLTQLLQIYDEAQYRPERLVTQILGALQTSTDVMFPEEISDVLSALAALHLANPSLLASLARAIATQLTRFTYLQLTALTGALRQLNVQSDVLFGLIEDRLNLEVQLMTIQEVLHTHQNIKTLNLSWKPYEDCVEAELRKRLGALQGNRDIEQFADPMAAFAWVEQQKLASPQYLKALAGWCAHECGKAEPRLDATDLLRVYNALREANINPNMYLGQALRAAVVTGGRTSPEGSSGPLLFKRHRRYIRVSDPLIALKRTVRPLDSPQLQTARLVTALRQHRIPEIPPGLDIVPEQLTKKLYAQPHIGALWSATVARPRAVSRASKTTCYTERRTPPAFTNNSVPGYDLPEEARPIKHPLRWL